MTGKDTDILEDADIAVVHDGAIHPGGSEIVAVEAATALDADLYVGFAEADDSWWESRAPHDVTILAHRRKGGTLTDMRTVRQFLNLSLDEYDVVVTSGPTSKFFQPYDDQYHVHYMHHPPLGSLWYEGGLFNYVVKTLDRIETQSTPIIIANSQLTATRAVTQYSRESVEVVNPPVDVDKFRHTAQHEPGKFVMVGRLEERKRPRVAVEAFRQLHAEQTADSPHLHLVGDGPLKKEIRRDAPDNVTVHGYLDDDAMTDLVEQAWAGVFLAQREDFGITPIEYMAAGLPVVGVDEQNTNNQVSDGETGVLVNPTPDAVCDGVRTAMETDWDRERINRQAETYRTTRFQNEIRSIIRGILSTNAEYSSK